MEMINLWFSTQHGFTHDGERYMHVDMGSPNAKIILRSEEMTLEENIAGMAKAVVDTYQFVNTAVVDKATQLLDKLGIEKDLGIIDSYIYSALIDNADANIAYDIKHVPGSDNVVVELLSPYQGTLNSYALPYLDKDGKPLPTFVLTMSLLTIPVTERLARIKRPPWTVLFPYIKYSENNIPRLDERAFVNAYEDTLTRYGKGDTFNPQTVKKALDTYWTIVAPSVLEYAKVIGAPL